MKFINRESELEFLKETCKLAESKLFTLSIVGLRRVGKTRLVLEILKKEDLYFFVNKDKSSESLLFEYQDLLKKKKILGELESVSTWDEFFKVIFMRFKGIVVFDEFQNFNFVNPSIFGILQKDLDFYENTSGLMLILLGSVVGLLKKIFFDQKEPLYGRIKRKLFLPPLSFKDAQGLFHELRINKAEDKVAFYAVFGGFPKYYVSVEDENLSGGTMPEILERLFFRSNCILESEAKEILSLEFGKRSGVYYDILSAIANRCTSISKVAAFLNKKESAISRQLQELINYFEFVAVEKQVVGNKSLLLINHPLINFWFVNFYKDLSAYARREEWLLKKVKENFNAYVGRRFELICREFLYSHKIFEYSRLGRQWGTIPGNSKDKNQYEIDICAVNEKSKKILFAECKWQEKVDGKAILSALKEKAAYVQWNNQTRAEHYVVFAKSFKEKSEGMYDLKDLGKWFNWEDKD